MKLWTFIVLTLITAIASAFAGNRVTRIWSESYHVEDWFVVDHVAISDAPYGEDHTMDVSRHIRKPFTATWVSEVITETGALRCTGSGKNAYELGDTLPDPLFLFDWWLWLDDPKSVCVEWPLSEGCYYADTAWTVVSEGPTWQTVRERSNRFCVTSP